MKKIIITAVVVILFAGAGYFLFGKYIMNSKYFAAALASVSPAVKSTTVSTSTKDWGTVSSNLGFSIKYPYKEIGAIFGYENLFQVVFILALSSSTTDATSSEQISDFLSYTGIFGGFGLSVINDDSKGADLKVWAKKYIKNNSDENRKSEKVLSEKFITTTLFGIKGFKIIQDIEQAKSGQKIYYTREEFFARKGKYIYYTDSFSPSDKTPTALKEYLKKSILLSSQVLSTFKFDKSTTTAITVPRIVAPLSSSADARARREKLLTALRTGPFFDDKAVYSISEYRHKCDLTDKNSTSTNTIVSTSSGTNVFVVGLYVAVDSEYANIHMYDNKGGHTGYLPKIPGYMSDFDMVEERVQGVNWINLGSIGYGLSFRDDNIDGRIELVGKEYGFANFRMSSDGNGCTLLETFITTTPYSVAKIPMTSAGDIGPISYDIDGDGKEDFQVSLVHPLLPEKQKQIEAVMADMQIQDVNK